MATKSVAIRLSAENAEKVKAVLRELGAEGQKGLARIEQAGRPASRGLQLVNAAALEASGGLARVADRAGPLAEIARALGPAGIALGAVAGGAVALGVAARGAAREVAEIGDAADRAGVAAETFEALRAALFQVGQGGEAGRLEAALAALNKRIGEARAGAGEAVKVFQALGIRLEDDQGPRRFEAVLADIADRMREMDEAQRLAFAQKLGEEAFRALVPVLKEGSEGLSRMAAEAERTGLLFGGEVIRNAQELNAVFERQAEIVQVQLRTAFLEAGPAVAELTGNLAALLPVVIEVFATFARGLVVIGDFLGLVEQPLAARLADRVAELREVQAEIAAIATAEDPGGLSIGGFTILGGRVPVERLPGLREREAQLLAEVRALSEQAELQKKLAESAAKLGSLPPPTISLGTGSTTQAGAFEKALAQIEKQIAAQRQARAEIGLTAAETARLRAETLLLAAAQEQFGTITEQDQVRIHVLAEALAQQTALTEEAAAAEKRWEEAAKRRAAAQEEAARVTGQAIERVGETLAEVAMNTEGALRRLAAVALQAMAGAGPFGPLVNQLLGVTGGGLIASLLGANSVHAPAQSPLPVARPAAFGADFTVAGAGGVDSQLLAMRVTPGERVRVDSAPPRDRDARGEPLVIQQSWEINANDPAMVEEVLMRHRETFARDAQAATLKALIKARQGARGTLGRLLGG